MWSRVVARLHQAVTYGHDDREEGRGGGGHGAGAALGGAARRGAKVDRSLCSVEEGIVAAFLGVARQHVLGILAGRGDSVEPRTKNISLALSNAREPPYTAIP